MANLILNGSTSGSVTLSSPAVSGTTTLTLPTTTGTVVVTSGAQTIEFADGSESTPSITNSGDTNTGMFFPAADTIAFAEGGAERIRIDSDGNLLVGKTDTTLSTGGLIIEKYTAAGETAGKISVTNRIGTGQYILQGINASGGIVGGVVTTSTATSFNTSSDYRLKENIVPMTGALDKVAQLKPVTYTWKADGSNAQGFIAHELAEVVPDCVTGEKNAVDAEGNPVYQGIDTSFLVATLTAAIQEQQTIINDLKARIETLESK
jgi:hypothetical protein